MKEFLFNIVFSTLAFSKSHCWPNTALHFPVLNCIHIAHCIWRNDMQGSIHNRLTSKSLNSIQKEFFFQPFSNVCLVFGIAQFCISWVPMALIWGCYYFWGSVFGDCINAGGCVSVRVCVIFGGIVLGGCVLVFEGVVVRQLVNTL